MPAVDRIALVPASMIALPAFRVRPGAPLRDDLVGLFGRDVTELRA